MAETEDCDGRTVRASTTGYNRLQQAWGTGRQRNNATTRAFLSAKRLKSVPTVDTGQAAKIGEKGLQWLRWWENEMNNTWMKPFLLHFVFRLSSVSPPSTLRLPSSTLRLPSVLPWYFPLDSLILLRTVAHLNLSVTSVQPQPTLSNFILHEPANQRPGIRRAFMTNTASCVMCIRIISLKCSR